MNRKLLALILALMTLAALLVPSAQASGVIMYVYTENGGSLNVRRDPIVTNNIIGKLNYGQAVSVRITMANGWACIDWNGTDTSVAYVQSRYLSWTVPTTRPVTPTPAPAPITPDSSEESSCVGVSIISGGRFFIIVRSSVGLSIGFER